MLSECHEWLIRMGAFVVRYSDAAIGGQVNSLVRIILNMFTARKIEEKSSPFLKEKSFKNPKPRVFFGPEITTHGQQRPIFSKNFFIWIIVLVIVLLYLSLGIANLFSPPKIIIDFPPENYITAEKTITVKGRVSNHETIITINNQIVSLNEKNVFEEKISLLPGVNTIKISCRKKLGQERTIFRQIVVR